MKTSTILFATILTFSGSLYAQDHFPMPKASSASSEIKFEQPHHYREIHTEALSKLVRAANPLVIIVDARGIKYDDGKRIPGAKTIPSDATIQHITANLSDKEAMIIVYCSNFQCPASGLLADRLTRMGYKNVWKYPGGIEEWEASGHKVEKGKTAAQSAAETGPKSA